MSLPALGTYPDAEASWTTLTEKAADLKSESKRLQEAMDGARTSWRGLESGYQHPDTQEQVWTALDDLVPHAEDWATALSSAQDAVDDFVETGKPLQTEREALDTAKPGLSSRRSSALSSDDESLVEEVRTDIIAFNERASALTTDWETAQETLSTALAAISIGTTEGLPLVTGHRDSDTGVQDWSKMTSGLDEKFGEIDPDVIWKDLKGLDEDELRDWLEANPEAARALAEHRWEDNPPAGTPESIMDAAMDGDAHLTEDGIKGIQEAWLSLSDAERERMALLYPGVIGVLNGVPLATRGQTNQITVAGLREQTAETLAEHRENRPQNAPGNAYERGQWEDELERLETVQDGLDQAWDAYGREQFPSNPEAQPGYTTLFVSTAGNGQIATMRGTPSANTERVATFIPGTSTTIASVDGYNQKLDTIDGPTDPEGTVSIYWAGTDFPQSLVGDNKDSTFNEQGAPLLAAFDHAADLDIPASARTTAIGHSAGGSMLGTAERGPEGLTSDNIVYVAPAGQGHEVGSPADTANPDANRYWIQTNYDRIRHAQDLGGGGHGPSWWEGSDIDGAMGATRLEAGYLNNGDVMGKDDGFAGGHSDYFEPDSTSALNLEALIHGGDSEVVLYHEKVDDPGPSASTTDPIVDRQDELSGGGNWDEDQLATVGDLED
ncbi:alpha/beta hydrolase [Citricoccus nitrophenolicus]|uniref:alpha/beta hydrolase n=1 Tax=Citricoccus nitrophenolicus TaxID=863575 RepID=UPI0031E75E75